MAATKFVGGNGALVYLFRKLIPFQTVLVLLTTSTAIAVALLGGFAAMPLLSLFNTAFGLVALYWITRIVAEVYDFGMGSGCVAILAGGLIGMAIFFCGGLALLSVLSSLLGAG